MNLSPSPVIPFSETRHIFYLSRESGIYFPAYEYAIHIEWPAGYSDILYFMDKSSCKNLIPFLHGRAHEGCKITVVTPNPTVKQVVIRDEREEICPAA